MLLKLMPAYNNNTNGRLFMRARLLERVASAGIHLEKGNNLIAFSGGVDSSVVAYAVNQVFPHNSLCILGRSASLPNDQIETARKVAQYVGIKLVEVETNEGKSEQYIKNEGMSCYSCKTHLYSALNSVITHAKENQVAPLQKVVLFNGTNKDDLIDSTRVGLLAAQDFNVSSPLDEFSKMEVRALAKEFGLFNHDYAASPCLRSRLAFGVTATEDNLRRIERAERLVRETLQIGVQQNMRVRHISNLITSSSSSGKMEVLGSARIELDAEFLQDLQSVDGGEKLQQLAEQVSLLGFVKVVFQPFRSGGVATALRRTTTS